MGTIQHHAVIATTTNRLAYEQAVAWCRERTGQYVEGGENAFGYSTLTLLPDGSKEGWEESDNGNKERMEFILMLGGARGSLPLGKVWDYVEVSYGELGAKIEHTNCVSY
jgi:hypothetical protein